MRAGSRVLVAAVVVAVAAACSSGSGSEDEGATNTAPSSTLAFGECLEQGANIPRAIPEGDADAYLVDVRVTRLDLCSDEVVFEFRSSGGQLPPGYEIGYESGPFRDFTSGAEFDPAGEAYLVIRFRRTGTAEVVAGPEGEPDFNETFDLGRESIAPSDMNHLQEARIVEGPERTVQWVIGVDSERPFTVDASALPMPLPPETAAPPPDLPPPIEDPSTSTSPSSTTTTTVPLPATSRIVVRIG
jgi:hypothetical protein